MLLLFLATLSLCALSSSAARQGPTAHVMAELHSEGFPGGLKGIHAPLQHHLKRGSEEGEDWSERRAYIWIKFTVPPSNQEDFEEAWSELEDGEEKAKGDTRANVFDLKSSKLDNLFYFHYGEWETVNDLVDHLNTDHWQRFTDAAQDLGIMWSLQFLDKETEDLEDRLERKRDSRRGRESEKELASVLFYYFVPPEESENFVDQWRDTAKDTLSEEGNRIYSLASLKENNFQFYGYGSWDSMDDFRSHYESDHVSELREYMNDRDIIYIIIPLEKIGRQSE